MIREREKILKANNSEEFVNFRKGLFKVIGNLSGLTEYQIEQRKIEAEMDQTYDQKLRNLTIHDKEDQIRMNNLIKKAEAVLDLKKMSLLNERQILENEERKKDKELARENEEMRAEMEKELFEEKIKLKGVKMKFFKKYALLRAGGKNNSSNRKRNRKVRERVKDKYKEDGGNFGQGSEDLADGSRIYSGPSLQVASSIYEEEKSMLLEEIKEEKIQKEPISEKEESEKENSSEKEEKLPEEKIIPPKPPTPPISLEDAENFTVSSELSSWDVADPIFQINSTREEFAPPQTQPIQDTRTEFLKIELLSLSYLPDNSPLSNAHFYIIGKDLNPIEEPLSDFPALKSPAFSPEFDSFINVKKEKIWKDKFSNFVLKIITIDSKSDHDGCSILGTCCLPLFLDSETDEFYNQHSKTAKANEGTFVLPIYSGPLKIKNL